MSPSVKTGVFPSVTPGPEDLLSRSLWGWAPGFGPVNLSACLRRRLPGGWGKLALAPEFPAGSCRPEWAGLGRFSWLASEPWLLNSRGSGLASSLFFPPAPFPFPACPSTPSLPGFLGPLSLCLSSHRFQGFPSPACLSFRGPSGCFDSNYVLTTVTTDTKTNVPGVGGAGGSDRLVPGGLIKGDPLGLGGDESCS